jgi:tripartite-type tricarboxylate transporter receptor subunit TctC
MTSSIANFRRGRISRQWGGFLRNVLRCVYCLSVLVFSGTAAAAEAFPTKPIRLIVGFPPGGAVDILARTVAPALAKTLGVQVVIDNRGGANGIIGADLVAKAAPDGYTIGLVSISSMVLNVHMYPSIPYHTLRDFTPLTTIGLVPFAVAVHPGVPARSLMELIALARSKPGMLTFGSPGVGGLQHLTIEMLNSAAKIRLEHVPYKGTGPALTDVLGGHIDGMVTGISGLIPLARNGKLRVLAITGEQRSSALPDVPTVREQGLPNFVVVNWYAIAASPNLPASLANTLHGAIVKVVAAPAVADKLVAAGVDPKTDASPAAFAQFVREEFTRWGKVVKDSGVKVE